MKFLPCYPSLLCANTRSAVNKMDEISTTLKTKNVCCFVATETWFRDIHHHNMFCIEDFTCFRDDRTGRVGGGVAIWAKQTLNAKRVPLPSDAKFSIFSFSKFSGKFSKHFPENFPKNGKF